MGSKPSRKMVFEQNLHKTGGSHIYSHDYGSFCDVKKVISLAAHPGVFLKTQKYDHF